MKFTTSHYQQLYQEFSKINSKIFGNIGQEISHAEESIDLLEDIKSSIEQLRRPEHQVVGFLEDYAEFLSGQFEDDVIDWYTRSILESTVDGTIIKGARRSYGPRVSSDNLKSIINATIEKGSNDQDPLVALDKCGLKTEAHKYKCSLCNFTNQKRMNIEGHIKKGDDAHKGAVVEVLLGNEAKGKICPICDQKFYGQQFFKHIRGCHGSSFPLRCGYCEFMGQDYNQIRQHIQKKHKTSQYKIINIPRILEEVDQVEESKPPEHKIHAKWKREFECPVCHQLFKTFMSLKNHLMKHGKKRLQCMLCPYTTVQPTQMRCHYRSHHPQHKPEWQTTMMEEGFKGYVIEDVTPYIKHITAEYDLRQPDKKSRCIRQYHCPHCNYTCSFNSSYNRHLRIHQGIKPFKCGYCDFHAREAYVIRRHSNKEHEGKEPVVESGKTVKAPYRYSNKIKENQSLEHLEAPVMEKKQNIKKYESRNLKKSPEKRNCTTVLPLSAKALQETQHPEILLSTVASQTTNTLYHKCVIDGISTAVKNTSKPPLKESNTDIEMNVEHKKECQLKSEASSSKEEKVAVNMKESQHEREISSNFGPEVSCPPLGLPVKRSSSHISLCSEIIDTGTKDARSYKAGQIQQVNQLEPITVKSCTPDKSNISPSNVSRGCSERLQVIAEHSITEGLANSSGNSICKIFLSDSEFKCPKNDLLIQLDTCNNLNTLLPTIIRRRKSSIENSTFRKIYSKEEHTEQTILPLQTELLNSGSVDSYIMPENDSAKLQQEIFEHKEFEIIRQTNKNKPNVKEAHIVASQSENLNDEKSNEEILKAGQKSDTKTYRNSNALITRVCHKVESKYSLNHVYTSQDYFSRQKVRNMMRKEENGQVTCIECGVRTAYRAFYKHARKHFNSKPYKCGYCPYKAIDKNKIRVHTTFCHSESPCIIVMLSPEAAALPTTQNITKKLSSSKSVDMWDSESNMITKQSKNTENMQHQESSKNFLIETASSTLMKNVNTIISTSYEYHPNKRSFYQCPVCSKNLRRHTITIKQHLFRHYHYKPYKCGYCSFTGYSQSEVKVHHVIHGSVIPSKVEYTDDPMPEALASLLDMINPEHHTSRKTQASQQCPGVSQSFPQRGDNKNQ